MAVIKTYTIVVTGGVRATKSVVIAIDSGIRLIGHVGCVRTTVRRSIGPGRAQTAGRSGSVSVASVRIDVRVESVGSVGVVRPLGHSSSSETSRRVVRRRAAVRFRVVRIHSWVSFVQKVGRMWPGCRL